MASGHLWACASRPGAPPGPTQQRGASEQPEDADEQLLGLWDHMWFGLGSSSPGCSNRRKSAASFTADPLDNVVPVMGFAAMLPELMQPDGMVLPLSTNTLQQAALNGQLQHQQGAGQAAALAAPSQPRPMWVPSAGGVAASRAAAVAAAAAAGSPDGLTAQQQPQQQQSRELHQQQQEQDQRNPAPFVLGTWAQRQYILPVPRPGQTQSNGAASPAGAGGGQHHQHDAKQGGSSSPARPIPRGKFPSSNGSSNSSGSTRGKAAQRGSAVQHSSSGGSSEPPPAAATQQGADDASAAADAAEGLTDGVLGGAANGDDVAAAALWQAAADAGRASRRSLGTDEEEEAVQQIAWRWRFARRWQAEQTRGPLDPTTTASVGDGGMEEALQYLAACGENWQHLSRESSRLGTVESRLLGTLGSLGGLGSELLADESFSAVGSGYGMQATLLHDTADSGGPLAASCAADSREVSMAGDSSSCDGAPQQPLLQQEPQAQQEQGQQGQAQAQQQARRHRNAVQPRGEATVQVTGITKRAQELLVAQADINRQANARWQQVSSKQGSSMWVGALLEGVCVDPWGKFKFMLLRVKDRNGRQVLLVRGANNASESKIVEELRKEMLAVCNANDLPAEAIDILGGGIMEWTQHRDRHLHISGGYVARAGSGSGGPTTAGEVMRLAAVLTQQALPMHYKVTSDGDKQKL